MLSVCHHSTIRVLQSAFAPRIISRYQFHATGIDATIKSFSKLHLGTPKSCQLKTDNMSKLKVTALPFTQSRRYSTCADETQQAFSILGLGVTKESIFKADEIREVSEVFRNLYSEETRSSVIHELKNEINNLSETQKENLHSLLSIQRGMKPMRPLDWVLTDVRDALYCIIDLDHPQIKVAIDEEKNEIQMENQGWKLKAQAVSPIGRIPPRGLFQTPNGNSYECITANTTYKSMQELIHKLSLLSTSDKMKFKVDGLTNVYKLIDQINHLALQPDCESKELQVLVTNEMAELRKIRQERLERLEKEREGKIKLSDLTKYTEEHYKFPVFDWDMNRGERKPAGKYLVAKVDFDRQDNNDAIDFSNKSLKGCSVEQIADLFNTIMKDLKGTVVDGYAYMPVSIHLGLDEGDRIPEKPFLFVLGNRILKLPPNLSQGTIRLLKDLALKESTKERDSIIKNALMNYYDDFLSPLDCPKLTLEKHLKQAGFEDLAQEVFLEGRYDEDNDDPSTQIFSEKLKNEIEKLMEVNSEVSSANASKATKSDE